MSLLRSVVGARVEGLQTNLGDPGERADVRWIQLPQGAFHARNLRDCEVFRAQRRPDRRVGKHTTALVDCLTCCLERQVSPDALHLSVFQRVEHALIELPESFLRLASCQRYFGEPEAKLLVAISLVIASVRPLHMLDETAQQAETGHQARDFDAHGPIIPTSGSGAAAGLDLNVRRLSGSRAWRHPQRTE
ncbi:MAG: hypothetical protein GXP55_21380 [Deltaproteobacteria bacterium]|nr:hypothetical protein [Deltaproteobacteria bacterium]